MKLLRHSSNPVKVSSKCTKLLACSMMTNMTIVWITRSFQYLISCIKGLQGQTASVIRSSMSCKTSTLGDILQSLLLSSAVADKCRRYCQNANSSLTDFCLVLFWEHSPWWTSLFSSIFVELSSREANRDVQWPYCVTLVLQLHAELSCFLFLLPLLVHTDAHQVSTFHEFNIFCTVNKFPLIVLSICTNHNRFWLNYNNLQSKNIPEKYCLSFCFIWLKTFF